MRILILTDHATHQSSNSFYLIANSLFQHSDIQHVVVASRGCNDNQAFFEGRKMELHAKEMNGKLAFDSFNQWIQDDSQKLGSLDHFDYILLRLPRPIHPSFFSYLLTIFEDRRIINRPSGIAKTGNKSFLLELKDFCAPIKLVNSVSEILDFKSQFPIVLKPLEDYGGRGIIKIQDDVVNIGNSEQISFKEFAKIYKQNPQPYLAMKFLKNVQNGDKRIVVANGIVLTSSLRFPAKDSWLCNIAQGGSAELSSPTKDEKLIIENINPILQSEGIFMYGLDTLENDEGKRIISEINTLSVGGIAPAEEMSKTNIGERYAELFVNFVNTI